MARRKARSKRKPTTTTTIPVAPIPPSPGKPHRIQGKVEERSFDPVIAPSDWPSLSVCMIVKNEAESLADCVASLGDLPGELIIIDTGSEDKTVEIARSLGAKVGFFTWIDDFAAARNHAINQATQDWIMVFDADDRLTEAARNQIKQALANSHPDDTFFFRITSQAGENSKIYESINQLRIIPNHRGLHYQGRLHEDLSQSVMGQGLTLVYTNIELSHTGYAAGKEKTFARGRRNERIVRRILADEPDNRRMQAHLGIALFLQERWDEAETAMTPILEEPPETLEAIYELYIVHAMHLQCLYHLNDLPRLNQSFELAKSRFGDNPALWTMMGNLYWELHEADAAIACFEEACRLPEPENAAHHFEPGLPERRLTLLYTILHDLPAAADAHRRYLAKIGQTVCNLPDEQIRAAQSVLANNAAEAAIKILEPQGLGDARALKILVDAYSALARAGDIQQWAYAIYDLSAWFTLQSPAAGDWRVLAELLLISGNIQDAKPLTAAYLNHHPDSASMRNIAGIIATREGDVESALREFVLVTLISPDYQPAQDNLQALREQLDISQTQAEEIVARTLLHQSHHDLAAALLSGIVAREEATIEIYRLLAATLNALGREEEALLLWQQAAEPTQL